MESKGIKDVYTVDLKHILKTLKRWIWLIALAGIITAAIGFLFAAFFVEPKYSASIKIYVRNRKDNNDNTITTTEIVAAQNLVNTYCEILHSKPTYEQVLKDTGVSYNSKQLSKMIDAGSSNETEVMYVTVTSSDPEEAALIANSIATILPTRISEVIEGATARIIETAEVDYDKVSPSTVKYALLGLLLGLLLSSTALCVIALADNKIHNEDYIIQTYGWPILAKIPDLSEIGGNDKYKYYDNKDSELKTGDELRS